ncbi:MAG TPA: glutamate 5-kinase [Propioniciclava sp.]|uniref:glutamate 5-kinase n=1 Tax=Propioniciclava sp. TaxID=2038686 RepID=UPI002C9AAD7F|nr:glutamate 5-kinase [Propioniciclava sp.]HRL47816.1 glutamate 5-kinase [Propioniciclava sp.]HRL79477.1 glutamate 5-kinase [Propioniciclava sp.]
MSPAIRRSIAEARRIVVKVGSSSITDRSGRIDMPQLNALVDAIAAARAGGTDVVVVSSGAVAAGLEPLGMQRRPRDLATRQAAASVGQGLLLARYTSLFAAHGLTVGQVLMTVEDVTRQASYANAQRTFTRLLELGAVPVVNENDTVATNELRFGDNDRLAALVAHLVGAEALFLLSDVDALYTDHPSRPGARRITDVAEVEDLDVDTSRNGSSVGTGGMTTKLEAARIATHAGVNTVLASATAVRSALAGEPVGTLFRASDRRRSRKMLWLAYASKVEGVVSLDAGAVRAVVERKASLLPAGVTGFTGDFHAGDPVRLVGPDGALVGHGLVNYSSDDLPDMLGRSTRALAAELGEGFDRELVHRDAMILRKRFRG